MVEHIVLFKWSGNAEDSVKDLIARELRKLPDQIEEIMELSCGRDFSGRSKGYDFALIARFQDRHALEGYLSHPAHQSLVETLVRPNTEETLAFDYIR